MVQLDFKISTGLKNIIGKELITDDNIAIFELVKNSYDADAKKVKIIFQNVKKRDPKHSKILIIDDGEGMSYEDIVNKWLFVGFSAKKVGSKDFDFRNKVTKRNRVFAGAKGIGRFSADRLGGRLDLYTKKANEKQTHHLHVDWKQFEEDQAEQFQSIKTTYTTASKIPINDSSLKDFRKGTILEISLLNSKWDQDKLWKLRMYLQRLINPSQDPDNEEFKIELKAEEFIDDDKAEKENKTKKDQRIINGPVKNLVFEKLKIKTTQITCSVDAQNITTRLTDKGRFVFELTEQNPYQELKGIEIIVSYLNQKAKKTFTDTMGLQPVKYGSIFLYKNGFRIHPYGDEDDDWLGLESRKAQGYRRYLSGREMIGRIEVYGVQSGFQEVSSRDAGVIDSEAMDQLRILFKEKVLRRLERYVVEAIDWDSDTEKSSEEIKIDSLRLIEQIAGQIKDPDKNVKFNMGLLSILKEREIEKVSELIHNMEHLRNYVSSPEEKKYIDRQIRAVRIAAQKLEKEKRRKEEELRLKEEELHQKEKELEVKEKESLFLKKAVSTDKETIMNLNHTIENATLAIQNHIRKINEKIKQKSSIEAIVPFVDKISLENEKVVVLSGIVSSANFNMLVQRVKKDVIRYIKEYVEMMLGGKSEELKCKFQNAELNHTIWFKPLEVSIIIDNFITNARKAYATEITFVFKIKEKELHLYVADNGEGVSKGDEKYLFTRGFTTTTGSGLGLHHIRMMAEASGGNAKFIGNNFSGLGKGACFEVVFR